MKRNLFLIIMMLFVITSISNVYAQEMKEEIFLKNSENTRDEINLRKHFLKDLIQNKQTLEIKSFKQSNKLEHKSISEAGLNKNSLQGASFENIDVIKFPEIEINKKLVKLYPESTKTRDEILSINKNFYELLRQDIRNKLEIDVSIEDLSDQSKIDYFMLSYLGLDSINLDRADVVSFFDAISLTNNTDRNNHTLYLIYNEKLDQFDEEVTEPVEIQNENSNLSITDTNKSENSFFRNTFQTYSSYNRWDAANYAISWWHLTNNMDYPYYARYYKYDTNRNDYNQLPYDGYENKSQSNPRRGWNDCTNFVSQALAAGGLQQNSDWKYRDSFFQNQHIHGVVQLIFMKYLEIDLD